MLKLENIADWVVGKTHAVPHSEFKEAYGLRGYHPKGSGMSDYKKFVLETRPDTDANGQAIIKMEVSVTPNGWGTQAKRSIDPLDFYLRRVRTNDGVGNTPPTQAPNPKLDIPFDDEYYYLVADGGFICDCDEGNGVITPNPDQNILGYQLKRWEIHAAEEVIAGVGKKIVFKDYIFWEKRGEGHEGSDDTTMRTSWRWIHN